jgi:hypothetical protein
VLNVLMKHVCQSMGQAKAMWDATYAGPTPSGMQWLLTPTSKSRRLLWSSLTRVTADEEVKSANEQMRCLVSLEIMVGMVEAVFPHLAYSHSRGVVTATLKAINDTYVPDGATEPRSILQDLGRVLKSCMRENVRLKLLYTDATVKPTKEEKDALLSPSDTLTPFLPAHSVPKAGTSATSPQLGCSPPNQHNLTILRNVLGQTVMSLEGLYGGIIARPAPRRNPDASYRQEAMAVATTLGGIMTEVLDITFSDESLLVDVASATLAVKAVSTLLDKGGTNSLSTVRWLMLRSQRNGALAQRRHWQFAWKLKAASTS